MADAGSVSHWLERLRDGDRDAVQQLWERYHRQLVTLARARLRDGPRALADEEDIALSAFDSFFRRAEQGQFPQLNDRDDLWSLLVMITSRKVRDLIEYEGRDKRDWRRARREGDQGNEAPLLVRLIGKEPDPAFAAEMADRCRQLLGQLDDDGLRTIAVRKLEGHTNAEIAALLDCAVATVERRLSLIRRCWGESDTEEGNTARA